MPGVSKLFCQEGHIRCYTINSSWAGHLAYCVWFSICHILSNQQIFRKYIILPLLTKWLHAPDHQMKWLHGPDLACGL